jgi:fibronectin-binding autotransporter adhesin
MKKLFASFTAFLLSVSSLSILLVGHAYAASKVWDGSAGDHKLSTGSNWVGDAAPSPGDDLIFPYGAGVTDKTPDNDFADDTAFSQIVFSGTSDGSESDYVLSGNSMTLSAGVAITANGSIVLPVVLNELAMNGDQDFNAGGNSLTLSGVITGAGNITKAGAGTVELDGNNTFTGTLDVNAGKLDVTNPNGLGNDSAGTNVNDGADITFSTCASSMTVAEPLTLTGDSSDTSGEFPTPKLETSVGVCSGGSGSTEDYGFNANSKVATISGDISLGSDITFASFSQTSLTGNLSGNYEINLIHGYSGKLTVNGASNSTATANGVYAPPTFTKTLSDSQPSNSVHIQGNTTITVTGTRGDIQINGVNSILKGTGTVGVISLIDGQVAPGMSPGVLNSGNLVFTGGSYEAQLGGTASGDYDQIDVSGTVHLGSATSLDTSFYHSFKPAVGDTFRIINNDGSDVITGTFDGLSEGDTFKVSGYTFKISYKGGTGNDVVITTTALPPKAPDTGLALITQNPFVSMALLCLIAPGFALAARRTVKSSRN